MSLLPRSLVEIKGSSQYGESQQANGKINRKINRLMVSNGTLKVRISENSAPISMTHAGDFTKYFHDIDISLDAQSS